MDEKNKYEHKDKYQNTKTPNFILYLLLENRTEQI